MPNNSINNNIIDRDSVLSFKLVIIKKKKKKKNITCTLKLGCM